MDDDDLPGAPETVPPPPPFRKGDVVRTAHGIGVVVSIVWNPYTWDLHCDTADDGMGVYSPASVTPANDDPGAVAQAAEFRLRRHREWDADPHA